MERHAIKDEDWARIEGLLPGRPGQVGRAAGNNRLFINAVLYIAKTGVPWRDLPTRFGKWDTVYQRFARWCRKGVWQHVFAELQDPDLEWLLLDSTVIRAHQHAAGMNTAADNHQLGYSRGGFSTKIHISVAALGNPVKILLSPGQDADVTHAKPLLEGVPAEKILGDKGYDSDALVETIEAQGGEAVIPPRSNRTTPRDYDKTIYKERNKVERCINLFKQFRRVATRYEKTARNFLGMVLLAGITILLR